MFEDAWPSLPMTDRSLVGAGCLSCRNLTDLVESTCLAFPGGIPLAILQDRVPHDHAYPGDRGIRFQPAEVRPGRPAPIR
jgi:hypothetical protein